MERSAAEADGGRRAAAGHALPWESGHQRQARTPPVPPPHRGSDRHIHRRHSRRKEAASSTSSSSALKVRKDRKPHHAPGHGEAEVLSDDDDKGEPPSLPPLRIGHPWIRDAQQVKIPLDMIIYKLMRAYISSSSLQKSALR
ncbi:hypothetical protein ZWY2020_005644, partial [Hordeum vulgare]